MGLLKPNEQLFDPVRKKWVVATPEEVIRQRLIAEMVGELGYPVSLIAVEKELSQLPHLQLKQHASIPKRRADIIVFGKNIYPDHPLFPLIMIECKAVPLTPKFARQVIGYNASVQAPFLALANEDEILTGHFSQTVSQVHFQQGLPTYRSMVELVRLGYTNPEK